MYKALHLASLAVRHLRCLTQVDLEPSPRFNVVSGDNGQGKTSLLEAIYLLATTRSFRASKLSDIVEHGAQAASVRAIFIEGDEKREQCVGLDGSTRRVTLDGKRPQSLAEYAIRSPVVVFHPGEIVLSAGAASSRRTLLDRVALFSLPMSLDHQKRYVAASRARQRILDLRRGSSSELDAYEHLMAEHGAAISAARRAATARIVPIMRQAFSAITGDARRLDARYAPGGPEEMALLERALGESRELDRIRKSARIGPHRDDLEMSLGEFEVRKEASQGEHRAITLALKIAEMACIAEARSARPILLLDDVSSELDRFRTAQLFALLGETPGQIFVTTTRPDLIVLPGEGADRRDFAMSRSTLLASTEKSTTGGALLVAK